MSKTKLKMEQIVAGALQVFKSLSTTDIMMLVVDFKRKHSDFKIVDIGFTNLAPYIKNENGRITLKDDMTLDTYLPNNHSTLRKRLTEIAGKTISSHFKSFNVSEFILRKINELEFVKKDELKNSFVADRKADVEKMEEDGLISTSWHKAAIYDDYEVFVLSDKGKVLLFKQENAEELERFKEMLKSMRYDTSLLDDFLVKQDLSRPAWQVLNIANLESFCNEYDRALTEPGASTLFFTRLTSVPKTILDREGKKLMEDMLAVYDNNAIYICHPNHLFAGAKPLTKDVRTMGSINWDDLDPDKMLRIGECPSFNSPNCQAAFSYIHKLLGHQIMSALQKGDKANAISYLAVVESYVFDYETYYIVRGIIRGDAEGYSLAFNPEYQKTIPTSTFEKGLRFGNNETPEIYLKKRPIKPKTSE